MILITNLSFFIFFSSSDPNLIIVLIVVLCNLPSLVRAKPLGSSSSSKSGAAAKSPSHQQQQHIGAVVPPAVLVAASFPSIASISPDEWFTVENGKVNLKRELSPAALKMERVARIGKETVNMMKVAISQMQHQLEQYVSGISIFYFGNQSKVAAAIVFDILIVKVRPPLILFIYRPLLSDWLYTILLVGWW